MLPIIFRAAFPSVTVQDYCSVTFNWAGITLCEKGCRVMGMQKPLNTPSNVGGKGRQMNVLGDNSRKREGTKGSKNKPAQRESYESGSIRG